jgi:pimeloyl-ACP methyl ester carboxylesterase
MQFIRSITHLEPKNPNGRTIVYMHGYGGFIWQARRQLKVLKEDGYKIVALDFKLILRSHNPQDLIDLMDEVNALFVEEKLIDPNLIMVGISLGGLVGYNMIRRHAELTKLIVITGGNIALLPSDRSLNKKWKTTREQLTNKWERVNMATKVGLLKGKHIIMFLPLRDKLINPEEVVNEFDLHQDYNRVELIRTKGGHFRTIITQTILSPKKLLQLIDELE